MANHTVGVLGATSLVGKFLLLPKSNDKLTSSLKFVAFSRRSVDPYLQIDEGVVWRYLNDKSIFKFEDTIENWVSLAPIWVLPDYFKLMEKHRVRKIVVLSSTSVITKKNSHDSKDIDVVARLGQGEKQLIDWAEKSDIEWVILRPTLIYGMGQDRNISSIANFIKCCGFFPLLGKAEGLRQPIHAQDVATACLQVLFGKKIKNKTYSISGGEVLSYKDMVHRVFLATGKNPRYLPIPKALFYWGIMLLRLLPKFKNISVGMAERMNQDLIFDHSAAMQDFGFSPRLFQLTKEDITLS